MTATHARHRANHRRRRPPTRTERALRWMNEPRLVPRWKRATAVTIVAVAAVELIFDTAIRWAK